MISTQTLDPEPIPLDARVVLFGDRELYYMLSAADPDFWRLFKVQADFDDSIARSTENDHAYARLIASIVKEHGLKPFDAAGVARLIDEGARLADDREKLSIEIGRIADIAREADYWSSEAKRKMTTRQDVARAIDEQIQRSDRLRDRAQETIARGIVLVDTDGAQVGQINGLSVLQLGSFSFGRPSRITARVRLGSGRVTDIEREVKLGGPAALEGRDDPVGLSCRALCSRRAAGAGRHAGVRAVLRRRRRRQRLVGRAACACCRRSPSCRSGSRWRSPARSTSGARCRRSAASTRRSRASSTSAASAGSTSSRAC